MRRNRARSSFAVLLAVFLSGCSLAPDYHRPAQEQPVAFKEVGGWITAQPQDAVPRGNWWEIYNEPQLNALEAKVGSGNEDLKAALARYQEARANTRAARADFFPNVTGAAHDFRERSSPNFSRLTSGKPFNDYDVEADLSWEIDVWGRIRNQVDVARNNARASDGDMLAIDLSLHAELATDYFALRADDAQQIVLDETAADYGKALDLTRNRFKGGVSAEADVDQAETQYQNTKTQAADLRLKRAQLEHAIAVLTGAPPSTFALAPIPLDLKKQPPGIHPGIPSKLLERRPDVAAAERRVMAANAEIGVTRAAWFPDFTIQGLLGLESSPFYDWLSVGSRIWSLGPSMTVPLYEGGRINALNDQARAAYDESAASYRKTVLNAYQEVEDNLVALHHLNEENISQTAATSAAERSLKQSQDRYTGGLITYLDVVVAQNIALQAELASIDIEARRLTASVQLIKALGGSWNAPSAPVFIGPPAPSAKD